MATAQNAKTQFVEAYGVKYAYRHIGPESGIPLVLQIHFRGNMDFWDPALINALAEKRPVIIFDNAGVGKSGGQVPETIQGWADHLIAIVHALNIEQIDLLGFSMGGAAAQMVALTAPKLIRKLILAGTMASQGPNKIVMHDEPLRLLATASTAEEFRVAIEKGMYNWTDEGRAAAKASWERIQERQEDRSSFLHAEGTTRQTVAFTDWLIRNPNNSWDRLGELKMPVLVANGDNDLLVHSYQSWLLADRIRNAQLIIYPLSGHGFLYQYAELFASHVHTFLDGNL